MKVQNYLLMEEIGSGSFSTVYKAQDINDPSKIYAIKSMRDIPQNDLKVVLNQIELLSSIKHKNVVNCVDNFDEKGKKYIVFEYCGKGDLQNYFKKNGRLSELLCKNLAANVIEALSQIHDKNIAHRDLKLSNILINDEYQFKIADFGMAKIEKDGILQSYCGTPYAMAPEVLKREQYDTKCDTWSLGIMLYQLVFGRLPFEGRKHGGGIMGLTIAVLQQQPNYNISGIKVSDQCLNFIKLCLRKDPKNRPAMKQLSKHPWLNCGIDSVIRVKQFRQGNSNQVNQQVTKRARQIFNEAVQQHIKRLVKSYRLSDTQIANFVGIFDKYYKQNTEIKTMMLLMITKIIKQLNQRPIIVQIQQKVFKIDLMKIKNYKNHIENLRELLSSLLSKLNIKQETNIERQIINFVISQAECCLNLNENLPDKVQLLRFLSKLPINIPQSSKIKIKWSFNDVTITHQKMFGQLLEKLSQQQICKFINQNASPEEKQKNWIIQHQFPKEKREGSQIGIGQFISKVIDINCPTLD